MFSQATILIDREPEEVYAVLTNLKIQIPLWGIFNVAGLGEMEDGVTEMEAIYQVGNIASRCIIVLHETRPKSGLVTYVQSDHGELAAEWRIIKETDRTKVEINIEGQGGGPAGNIMIRQLAPRILTNLKQHFDRA